jgi:hypothetical protein
MSYSRRQLYAMGEPLGDSATYRKADGGLVLGGGGSSSTPQNTTVSSTELPAWAQGYAKDTLANAANLTDVNKNPYQTYSQPRIAGFSPMQEQAQTAASNMSAGPEAFQQNMSSYMSPYMQNVVDVQKQEAARQSGIMGTQQQAQAAQAGAFGGGRDAIMRAERERNLGQQMNQIQAQGSQAAYDSAANQFRQGVTQDVAINQLQNQYGGQQQQLAQQGLNTNYQDFLNQQNYPYKQIGFMSDLVRGLPLGQQSTAQMYQAPPSMIQNVGALGLGAYGINQLTKANGGSVQSYADGGDVNSMDDPNAMTAAVAKLSDAQLQQIVQHPSSAAELQAAKLELATRASEKSGLAGAYNMAHGGMVAFAHGGIPKYDAGGETNEGENYARLNQMASNYDSESDDEVVEGMDGGADGTTYDKEIPENKTLLQEFMSELQANKARKGVSLRSDAQMEADTMARLGRLEKTLGGNQMYSDIEGQISKMRGENEGALSEGKGLAALQAAGAMLQGNDPMRGLGAAGSAFASSYAPALAAKRRADQSFTEMNINLSKARRAEKMGLLKEADMYEQNAEKNKIAAYNADTTARKMGLTAIPAAIRATRVNVPKPAAPAKLSEQMEYLLATPAQRAIMDQRYQLKAPGLAGVMAGVTGRTDTAEAADLRSRDEAAAKAGNDAVKLLKNTAIYREAVDNDRLKKTKTAEDMEKQARDAAEAGFYRNAPKPKADASGAAKTAKPDISKVEGAPPGSSIGEYDSGKGYKILDSKGKHIGYVQ